MSTNISKERREKLIAEIKAIREFIAAAPQDENTGNLLTYISEIEKDIKGKKYGLVFEEHRENIDEVLATHTPVLTEDKDMFIDNGGEMNFLIEGDNLATLQLLEKTHKGKIDLIYIDPPYNTGNKDFVYDDAFVDDNDTFRHSKWISFMKKRLDIAYRLLSKRGVIFISIDDKEQAQIKLLCDSIFDNNNFVSNMVWKSKSGGANDSGQIVNDHEYILVYAKNIEFLSLNKDREASPTTIYNYEDSNGRYALERLDKQNLRYSDSLNFDIIGPDGLTYKLEHKDPQKPNATWRWSKETIAAHYEELVFKNGHVYTKNYEKQNGQKPRSLLIDERFGRTRTGSTDLRKIVDTSIFSYPKPISLLAFITTIASAPNSIILDFFAGSGTTGHAVMKLNAEDGGNRKFILCTNNENNICRDITYERIKRVIAKEDYKASLKYFKVGFIPISDKLYYEYADELLLHIRELVELENGINFNENNDLAILLTEDEVTEFISHTERLAACKKIYLGHDVLLTGEQERLIESFKIDMNIIPEYYYKDLEA